MFRVAAHRELKAAPLVPIVILILLLHVAVVLGATVCATDWED